MTTAYQVGAFQFSAFQEGGQGSGGLPAWMLRALFARKRRPAPVRELEEEEETEPAIARAPLRLRPLPARVPTATLAPLRAMARAHEEKAFKAFVEQIIESGELFDS